MHKGQSEASAFAVSKLYICDLVFVNSSSYSSHRNVKKWNETKLILFIENRYIGLPKALTFWK